MLNLAKSNAYKVEYKLKKYLLIFAEDTPAMALFIFCVDVFLLKFDNILKHILPNLKLSTSSSNIISTKFS